MPRFLIVNADDCNLTAGVTRSILACHARGIVTSTTFLVNLPVDRSAVRRLKTRRGLGIGIHLNITLGRPVAPASLVRSLIDADGRFVRWQRQHSKRAGRDAKFPNSGEVLREWEAQLGRFVSLFGQRPTHMDTHHQLHDHPFYFHLLVRLARKWRLPVRRSRVLKGKRPSGLRFPDYLFGDLEPAGYWRQAPLKKVLRRLPEGVSEIICHPGKLDRALRQISSFTRGRESERRLFAAKPLRVWVQKQGIQLGNYGLCAYS